MSAIAPHPAQRLHYLDNLRVFCMLFGALLQASRVAAPPISDLVAEASDVFRMATFFVISGYFTQMLLSRHDTGTVVRRRLWILLVPLAFGLVAINPLSNVIASHHVPGAVPLGLVEAWRGALTGQPALANPDGVLMHLWFLLVLAGFVALSPLIARLPVPASLPLRAAGVLPVLALVVALCSMLVRGLEEAASRLLAHELDLVRTFLRYLPYFVLGMIGRRWGALWSGMHRVSLPLLAAGGALMAAQYAGLVEGAAATLFAEAARAVLTVGLIGVLLAVFAAVFDRSSRLKRLASDGVYTAYLLLVLMVWIGGAIGLGAGLTGGWLYGFCVVFSITGGYAVWWVLARRIHLARVLLSGR